MYRRFSTTAATAVTADYVVVGAGIVGVSVAASLRERLGPSRRIVVLDKEEKPFHASVRNSGVLHSGVYYNPDSLKAKLTREGNLYLHDYCARKGIALNQCGKLIVAKHEGDLSGLEELFRRAKANGVPAEEISLEQAKKIEPRVKTHKVALWSPSTSAADPKAVLEAQLADLKQAGVDVRWNSGVASIHKNTAGTMEVKLPDGSSLECGHVISAAGLYADKLAKGLGFAQNHHILPFIGLYLYTRFSLRTLVYPVPDIEKPFLGVHFTTTFDGKTKIGPTAIPALWREQYPPSGGDEGGSEAGLKAWLANFKLDEAAEILPALTRMLLTQRDVRDMAFVEVQKYLKRNMIKGASELVEGLDGDPREVEKLFGHYGKPGIRAQLVDKRTGKLAMDFLVEGGAEHGSTHVLNAVSPGWTSSRPFAELVVKKAIGE
jgi:(S)-2-hydroxyglutarate dehydrogenase